MRVPRKIKKAAKYIERYTCGLLVIPYSEFVVKGRYTKWKQKRLNEVKRELQRKLLEEWQLMTASFLRFNNEKFERG